MDNQTSNGNKNTNKLDLLKPELNLEHSKSHDMERGFEK